MLFGKYAAYDVVGLPHLQAELFWNIGPLSTMLENNG